MQLIKLNRRVRINMGIAFLFVLFVLFSAVYAIPNILTWNAYDDTKEYTTNDGKVVELNKVILADACKSNGVDCLENVALIHGKIDKGTIESLIIFERSNTIDTVCFHSVGGENHVAKNLMGGIRELEINTCLAEEYRIKDGGGFSGVVCDSACPLILMMGKKRTQIGDDIKIGIHRSGITIGMVITEFKFDVNSEDYLPYFSDEGHLRLFQRSQETPYKDMDRIPQEEWHEYNIFTEII